MVLRRCVALLLVDILVLHSQYYVLAADDAAPFLPDDDIDEKLLPLFEGEVSADTCKEPLTPSNGEMKCGKPEKSPQIYVCKAACEKGFEFPNRQKAGKIVCDLKPDGQWSPNYRFPNCRKEIVCKPSCKNGGECTAENVCTCPPRYTGGTCEEDKCKEPPSVSNGKMSCKNSTEAPDRFLCEAECKEGFQFTNKKKKESHTCNLRTGEWQPKQEFPECERICTPPCQNGGTCLEGNSCHCVSHFIGDKCEIEVCRDPPKPLHGKMSCNKLVAQQNSYACSAECQAGYNFPKGEKKLRHGCSLSTGVWAPAHEFPDCQEICNPPCENGGTCVPGNKCSCTSAFEGERCDIEKCNPPCQNGGKCMKGGLCDCPVKFRGERCEHENCKEPDPPFNGRVSCRNDLEFENRYSCQAECDRGYLFPRALRTVSHSCDLTNGEWMPEREFPDCEPTCNPPCQNGGQCLEGDRCLCSPQFKGERCQNAADTCKDPPSPANGKLTCSVLVADRYQCTLQCHPDYYLPRGMKRERHYCDMNTGKWTPKREFPDCELLCNPLCENGGKCIRGNKCTCRPEFTGERCQDEIPQGCVPEWTEYFNTDHPNRSAIGDDETLDRIRQNHDVCNGRPVKDIECKAIVLNKLIDYKEMDAFGLKCSKNTGFTCNVRIRQMECEDYTVRFLCDCDEPVMPIPAPGQVCPEVPSYLKNGCPASCRRGFACDGFKCVPIDDCSCFSYSSGVKRSKAKWTTENCELCDCMTGGHSRCVPKKCPDCLPVAPTEQTIDNSIPGNFCIFPPCVKDRKIVDSTLSGQKSVMGPDCSCTCIACPARTVLCPSTGECVSEELLCNGKAECPGVDIICPDVTEKPQPPRPQMCPEVPPHMKTSCPPCPRGLACDGSNCVPIHNCRCFTYGSGFKPSKAEWTTENCQRCECLPGGRSRCGPIVCPDCLRGQKSVMGPDCGCTCFACPARTVLCPSTGECVSEELLCKGDAECPGVDINCPDVTEKPQPPRPQMCPEVPPHMKTSCPPCPRGLACDGSNCVPIDDCRCFTYGSGFRASKAEWTTENCERCECLPGGRSRCGPIVCPDCLRGEKSVMGLDCKCACHACPAGSVLCPSTAECVMEELLCNGEAECPGVDIVCPEMDPTLPPNAAEKPLVCSTDNPRDTNTCEMLGNVFETFDGSSYQYEICNQVLTKELMSQLFSVTAHKTCNSFSVCSRHLVIRVDDTVIQLGPGIQTVAIQNTKVPVSNLWLVSQKFPDLDLKMNGNTLLFKSFKYHFDVVWDGVGNARIKVSTCLVNSIVGLCGFYNKNTQDDLTMPNGNLASGGQEFGDSWTIGSLRQCRLPKYSLVITKKADDTCNKLREEPFSSCIEQVKINRKVEACTAFMLECLQRSLKDRNKGLSEVEYDKCKCQAYESFIENCEVSRDRPAQEWRILQDCTPTCPKGMEWQDCGPGCELTCDNYRERSKICSSTCVRGCYCPAGLVRHQNQCVKPKMCHDCICRGHGDPNYITFDGRYYAFQGTCTYVLAQHLTSEVKTKNFRILATNVECPEEPKTSCIQDIKVVWNDHVVEKRKHNPVYVDEKAIRPEDSPLDVEGISITYVQNKSTLIHIKEINLVVRYFDQMQGFTVELPSFTYYNQTEGLCGVCNFVQSDDLYHREGYVTDDIEDFAYSWLEGPETRRKCELTRVNGTEPPAGVCDFTVSPCEAILDPSPYSKSCQNDVRYSQRPKVSMCRSKFQYAQQCCERGVSLSEWLELNGCASACPAGMVYKCTSSCLKTCENYKNYREDDCLVTPQNTCVCPEGEVLKLGRCVKIAQCEVCDARGHVIGDVWKDGPCKTCECLPDQSTQCTIQECPQPPVCDAQERLVKLKTPANSCCETYTCVFKSNNRRCPEPELELCPPGKAYVKKNQNGCPVYQCECFPELCPPSVMPVLEEGQKVSLVTTGCCPAVKVTCNPNLCAPPPRCHQGFDLSTEKGRCCDRSVCVPQKNVCTYQHRHSVLDRIQINLPLEGYYDREYQPGSSWQDGLCKKCTCLEINGRLTSNCKEEMCPTRADFPDAEKYFREEIPVPGFCCPRYVRKHCIDRGVIYKIGDQWNSPGRKSCNQTSMCVLDQSGEALIHVTFLCERNCK